jgi:hypothetical protein
MELDYANFNDIISSDDLNIKREELVFEAILKWTDYDPIERKIVGLTKIDTIAVVNLEKKKQNKFFFAFSAFYSSDEKPSDRIDVKRLLH